jgi:hypothetical protein
MTALWSRVKKVFIDPAFNRQMEDWENGVYRRTANPNATDSEFDPFDPEKVTCSIDDDEVDCATFKLEDDGYAYDQDNEWWVRTWTTNNGKESIQEVFQQLENGKWNKLMIGYGDQIFYEQQVDPE